MRDNLKRRTASGLANEPPSIIRAAQNDDVDELRRALDAGQSLSALTTERPRMNALHFAALSRAHAFLSVAKDHETFDPWVRDGNERLPIDHSMAFNDTALSQLFFEAMYPPGWADEPEVVPFPAPGK